MSYDNDVLIVGAGPVGLTLANELARHGVQGRIIDRAPAIREVSKAMILHVRTQEVLAHVGIAERARALAQPLTEVVVHAYGKHIGSWDLDDIDSPFRHPLILGQNVTQHLLLDRLNEQGGHVDWNTEAVSLDMDAEGVRTVVARTDPDTGTVAREVVRSRYIVGCEGSNSLVRKLLQATFEGDRYTGEQFIQADCRIRWALPKGRSYLFLTSVGYMMVIEFPADVVRIFISLPDAKPAGSAAQEAAKQLGAAESTTEVPDLEEIRENLERLSGFRCELSDPIWLARYRTSHRYADRFSKGRAFIAGDAAHVHVPIGGQGMNTGIQDAFNLGWKLAGRIRNMASAPVLDSYHVERHPVAASLIEGTNFAYTGILHPSQIKQHAARVFGPFLIRNARVQSFMRDTLEELRVSYPESPLNLDLGGARGPKPGERVLDATVVCAGGHATTSVSELTRGTRWTLLVFCGTASGVPAEAVAFGMAVAARWSDRISTWLVVADRVAPSVPDGALQVLIDTLEIAHERYGVSAPAFYLLRPDTYVAARGPIARSDAIMEYLERTLC